MLSLQRVTADGHYGRDTCSGEIITKKRKKGEKKTLRCRSAIFGTASPPPSKVFRSGGSATRGYGCISGFASSAFMPQALGTSGRLILSHITVENLWTGLRPAHPGPPQPEASWRCQWSMHTSRRKEELEEVPIVRSAPVMEIPNHKARPRHCQLGRMLFPSRSQFRQEIAASTPGHQVCHPASDSIPVDS